jgi:hypothetical protein
LLLGLGERREDRIREQAEGEPLARALRVRGAHAGEPGPGVSRRRLQHERPSAAGIILERAAELLGEAEGLLAERDEDEAMRERDGRLASHRERYADGLERPRDRQGLLVGLEQEDRDLLRHEVGALLDEPVVGRDEGLGGRRGFLRPAHAAPIREDDQEQAGRQENPKPHGS